MKMKSKRSEAKNCLSSKNVHLCLLNSEAKNCLSSKNVNLCLPDSVESSAQGIKILQKTTGGSQVNPNSFGS